MINVIIVLSIVALVGYACYYMYREKKNGRHCIGCPSSGLCNCNCQQSDK